MKVPEGNLARQAQEVLRSMLEEIPFLRVGGCLRFDGDALKQWLEARAVPEAEPRPPISELLARRRARTSLP